MANSVTVSCASKNPFNSLPMDLWAEVTAMAGDPRISGVCKTALQASRDGRGPFFHAFQEMLPKLKEDPLIARYVAKLEPLMASETASTNPSPYYKMLYEKMRDDFQRLDANAALAFHNRLKGCVVSFRILQEMAQRMKDISLQKAWPRMRAAILFSQGDIPTLPAASANASAIREWLEANQGGPFLAPGHQGHLNLENLSLVFVPREIQYLPNITSLCLYRNQIECISKEDFENNTQLTSLDLSNNPLREVSANAFESLTNLEMLRLRYHPHLTHLPENVFQGLTHLENLSLNDNALQNLPANFFQNLPALVELNLSHNEFQTLPENLFSTPLPLLQTLQLDGNRLETLPDGIFANLPALRFLYLEQNRLTTLSAHLFSTPLFQLHTLRLTSNQIQNLPDGVFANLPALKSLLLDQNQIQTLTAFVFQGLNSLGSLSLKHNPLLALPAEVLPHLPQLTVYLDYAQHEQFAPPLLEHFAGSGLKVIPLD